MAESTSSTGSERRRHGPGWAAALLILTTFLTLGVLLGGCGGPASTVFNQAAPLSSDARVAYMTRSNYAGTASVVGLRGTDGKEAWRTSVGARNNDAAAAVSNGVLYVEATPASTTPSLQPPGSGFILALRLVDGTTLWRTSLPQVDYTVDLTTDGTSVLAAAQRGGLYALDPADGTIRWHVAANIIGPAHPAGGVVVVIVGADQPPTDPSGIAAYRESDGALLWLKTYTTPVVTSQLAAYTSTLGDETLALDAADGHVTWSYESGATANGGFPHPSQVIGAGDQLVLVQVQFPVTSVSAPSKDYVAALDVHTGQVKWTFSPGFEGSEMVEAGEVRGGPLFATAGDATTIFGVYNDQLIALRAADGVKLWQIGLSPYYVDQLTWVDGVLFALLYPPNCELGPCSGPTNNRLESLNAATSASYWQRDLPDAVMLAGA